MLGQVVYLSRDLEKASRYPLDLPEHQKVVIRVKVNVGKVKKIDRQCHPLQKRWHDEDEEEEEEDEEDEEVYEEEEDYEEGEEEDS
ncbi:unnamed protein product [Coregonus sp. 'balchen']|nr:unnamed protein product [Coregonus sp. 'balchen']